MEDTTVPTTAPAAAPSTPQTTAPTPASTDQGASPSPATTPAGDQFMNDLREQMKAGLGKGNKISETFAQNDKAGAFAGPDTSTPAGTPTPSQPAATAAAPTTPATQQEQQPAPATPAVPTENQEPPKAVFIPKFGKEFSTMEIEAALEGFNYYHPRALKLQEDVQRLQSESAQLQQERAKIVELQSAPEMAFVSALRSNPDLLAKVTEVVREFDAQTVSNYQNQTLNAQQSAEAQRQKAEIEALKQREAQRQQAELNNYVSQTIQTVDGAVGKIVSDLAAEQIQITNKDLQSLTDAAVALVQVGKLQYTPRDLIAFYQEHISNFATKARSAKQAALGGYRERKEQLPPPPPSGGSAPQLASPRVSSFKEARSRMQEGLEMALQRMK